MFFGFFSDFFFLNSFFYHTSHLFNDVNSANTTGTFSSYSVLPSLISVGSAFNPFCKKLTFVELQSFANYSRLAVLENILTFVERDCE